MSRKVLFAALSFAGCLGVGLSPAAADDASIPATPPAVIYAARPAHSPAPARRVDARHRRAPQRSDMGGGFIEFLFGGAQQMSEPARPAARAVAYDGPAHPSAQPRYEVMPQQPWQRSWQQPWQQSRQGTRQGMRQAALTSAHAAFDPKYERQRVAYDSNEKPGTIIIDTPNKFLYLVEGDGTALRYGVGVGRPGFAWSGVKRISAKKEWPSWTPPAQMIARRPDLPRFMEGGPANPLGARALYLGSSLYRIHGSNEPWTIGTNVSSGCIRMRNRDVIDLYDRVHVGAKVIVL